MEHGREPEVVHLLLNLRSVHGAQSEQLQHTWRLFTSMGRSELALLEAFTGMPQGYWRRLENASWRVWAQERMGREQAECPPELSVEDAAVRAASFRRRKRSSREILLGDDYDERCVNGDAVANGAHEHTNGKGEGARLAGRGALSRAANGGRASSFRLDTRGGRPTLRRAAPPDAVASGVVADAVLSAMLVRAVTAPEQRRRERVRRAREQTWLAEQGTMLGFFGAAPPDAWRRELTLTPATPRLVRRHTMRRLRRMLKFGRRSEPAAEVDLHRSFNRVQSDYAPPSGHPLGSVYGAMPLPLFDTLSRELGSTSAGGMREVPVVVVEPPLGVRCLLGVICGGAAGIVSRALVHPLDTLRVLQTVSSPTASHELLREASPSLSLAARAQLAASHYWNTATRVVEDSRRVLKTTSFNWHLGEVKANPIYDTIQLRDSVRILYRGFTLSVGGAAPVYGVYFFSYEVAKVGVQTALPNDNQRLLVQVLSGFIAECGAATVWLPWEVIRQRQQLAAGPPRSMLQVAESVVAESGWKGLYSGLSEYMMLWGIFSPLMFVLYERGMEIIADANDDAPGTPPSLATSFCVGCASGVMAAVATSPIDVVKTRIQLQTPTSVTQYRNMAHGLREVVAHEGVRALYRGLLPRCLNAGLSIGSMMAVYSVLRSHGSRRLGYGAVPKPAAPSSDAHRSADAARTQPEARSRNLLRRSFSTPLNGERDPWTYYPVR